LNTHIIVDGCRGIRQPGIAVALGLQHLPLQRVLSLTGPVLDPGQTQFFTAAIGFSKPSFSFFVIRFRRADLCLKFQILLRQIGCQFSGNLLKRCLLVLSGPNRTDAQFLLQLGGASGKIASRASEGFQSFQRLTDAEELTHNPS